MRNSLIVYRGRKEHTEAVEETIYKVRVGEDGRWHYVGSVWIQATTKAIQLSEQGLGKAQIFAYHGDRRIGARRYENGRSVWQSGSMF